jgi:hypothetical protein
MTTTKPADCPNPAAVYYERGAAEQCAFLDRCDYAPEYRQAAKDWYRNERVWRPVTEERRDDALNAVPPVAMGQGGFIAGEPHAHTVRNEEVYYCFRRFGNTPHMMLMTVAEFRTARFPLASTASPTNSSRSQ